MEPECSLPHSQEQILLTVGNKEKGAGMTYSGTLLRRTFVKVGQLMKTFTWATQTHAQTAHLDWKQNRPITYAFPSHGTIKTCLQCRCSRGTVSHVLATFFDTISCLTQYFPFLIVFLFLLMLFYPSTQLTTSGTVTLSVLLLVFPAYELQITGTGTAKVHPFPW